MQARGNLGKSGNEDEAARQLSGEAEAKQQQRADQRPAVSRPVMQHQYGDHPDHQQQGEQVTVPSIVVHTLPDFREVTFHVSILKPNLDKGTHNEDLRPNSILHRG